MKKIFLYTLMLLSSFAFYSCSDKDNGGSPDRQFMTMFRIQDNANVNDTDPYYCKVTGLNTANLYWYKVNDCYGYEIKWFYGSTVQAGGERWAEAEAEGYMKGHVIIDNPDQIQLLIPNLEYSKDYRFAIRVLNSADLNDPKNSPWYGYGTQQNWQDYMGLTTGQRYECPAVPAYIEFFDDTDPDYKTKFKVHINKSTTQCIEWDEDHGVEIKRPYTEEELTVFKQHFKADPADPDSWKVDYFTIKPADETSEAITPYGDGKYVPTAEEWEQGWFLVEGVTPGTLYTVAAWDESIPVKVDASYKNVMERTKADPPAERTIEFIQTMKDTIGGTPYDISEWNVMKIDSIFNNYMNSTTVGEGQTFYLRGGHNYYFNGNPVIIKGFTFATLPKDLEDGKRAVIYLGGLTASQGATNFMTGNDSKNYADPTVQLKMNSVVFKNIDFTSPLAKRFDGTNGLGNYLINMYSSAIGFRLAKLEFDDCSFQNMMRGFYRVQGSYNFNIGNFIINDCVFYNMGPFDASGTGYNYIHFELKGRDKSNLLNNCQITNNVFYNNAHGALISDKNTDVTWAENVRWNVKVSNNTFVNSGNQKSDHYVMGYTGHIPGGSVMEFTNNLIILTKDADDVERPMNCAGWRVTDVRGGDGSGACTFVIGNNWSTNDNLTNGQVLTANQFTATSNSPGKWQNSNPEWYPMGVGELLVHPDNISATELMNKPNPPYHHKGDNARAATDYLSPDGIKGLYYNNTAKVLESDIYKKGIGAPRLRETNPRPIGAPVFNVPGK